jgi:hypothetical protein
VKKNICGAVVALFVLICCSGVLLAKEEEQAQVTVAPSFFLLDQGKLEKFNDAVPDGFQKFQQKVFPGITVNTIGKVQGKDLWFGSNTDVTWAISEEGDKTLTFVAAGITFSLEKPVQVAQDLTARYGGAIGYGISSIGAQFEKDGSLGDQLASPKYSEAYEFYLLVGAKAGLDYYISEKIALTGEAQYLLPIGSWGTKDFNLPIGGPNLTVGVTFRLP